MIVNNNFSYNKSLLNWSWVIEIWACNFLYHSTLTVRNPLTVLALHGLTNVLTLLVCIISGFMLGEDLCFNFPSSKHWVFQNLKAGHIWAVAYKSPTRWSSFMLYITCDLAVSSFSAHSSGTLLLSLSQLDLNSFHPALSLVFLLQKTDHH